MYFGSFNGIYVIELENDGLSLKGGINYAKQNKKLLTWPYEGAYVVKREDYYYLYVSQGSCCNSLGSTYNVQVFRGESPVGPFLNHKGESSESSSGFPVIKSNQYFVGPGHNAIAQDDAGNDFIVYHSYSTTYPSKRMLCIDKLDYGDVGWPSFYSFTPSYNEVKDGPKILLYQ